MDETTCKICGDVIVEGEERYEHEDISNSRTYHVECAEEHMSDEIEGG